MWCDQKQQQQQIFTATTKPVLKWQLRSRCKPKRHNNVNSNNNNVTETQNRIKTKTKPKRKPILLLINLALGGRHIHTKNKKTKQKKMNLTKPLHMYFVLILVVCIRNGIYGTRIPLEIVQLESGTRLNDEKIANTEYQVHDVDDLAYITNKHNKTATKTDDWFTRFTSNRKTIQEPRIFYQVGVSVVFIFLLLLLLIFISFILIIIYKHI